MRIHSYKKRYGSPIYEGETETSEQEENCPKRWGKAWEGWAPGKETEKEIPRLANGAEQVWGRKKATFLPS